MQANGVQMQLIVIIAKLSQPFVGLGGRLAQQRKVCLLSSEAEHQKLEMAPTHLDTKLVFRCPAINSVVLHLYEK